jgi:DNA-binding NarL/FixJ family response regulator
MRLIKTILADDHRIFTEGVKAVLQRDPDTKFEITGTVHNGMELIRLLKQKKVDLVILDLNLPEKDGLEVVNYVRSQRIDVKVLALSMYEEPKIIKSAFKAGVNGYILKSRGINELFSAIDTIFNGNNFIGEGVTLNGGNLETPNGQKYKKRGFNLEDRFVKKHNLTKRELEILQLITQALSNKQIAKTLFISDQTVSVHRKNIMRKLGVCNTAGLIKVAYDNSLV